MPPLVVLPIAVALVVVLIAVVRLHPFLALVLAAIATGALAPIGALEGEAAGKNHFVQALELTTRELGATAGKIGLVIVLASLIGMCLQESGAADRVVRAFLAAFGESRAALALLVASYVLSIPIFFDTFFMLVVPLTRALARRTGKDYLLYVLAVSGSGMITHSLVAPHPGPLAMAEVLHVDLGLSIVAGLVFGIFPTVGVWFASRAIARRMQVPLRPLPGEADEASAEVASGRPVPLAIAILPVIAPIALIGAASAVAALPAWRAAHPVAGGLIEFLGNRNFALIVGAVIGAVLVLRQRRIGMAELSRLMGPPMQTAGVVILITSAGGAFGFMLRNAGVGTAIQKLAEGRSINLVLLAWLVAAVIRIAQGSATVSMLTTAAMVEPLLAAGGGLPYHPVYVFFAIGCGAAILSWMNDSGFWVVCTLSGMNEREGLRTFSVITTVASVVGLVVALVASKLLPLV